MTHPFLTKAISRMKLGKPKPIWFDTLKKYPPYQPWKLPHKQPIQIEYPEDKLRSDFYEKNQLLAYDPVDLDDAVDSSLDIAKIHSLMLKEGFDQNEAMAKATELFMKHKEKTKEQSVSADSVLHDLLVEEKEQLEKTNES